MKQTILKLLWVLAAFTVPFNGLMAQDDYLAAEIAQQISNRAETGYLGSVEYDDAARRIDLFFVTATKSKTYKVERYTFDYDLNFIETEKLEFDQPEQVKSKFKWFNFNGKEKEVYQGVTAEGNMMGTMVFKQKEITRAYNWFIGRYSTTSKTLGKLKPKNDDGKKYLYKYHFENDNTGEVLAIMASKGTNRDWTPQWMNYKAMKVNGSLDITADVPIDFETPHTLLWNGQTSGPEAYQTDGTFVGDYVLVFAEVKGQGLKNKTTTPDELTVVRVSQAGQIKERFTFSTKATKWRIEGAHTQNGALTLYGPGFEMKDASDGMISWKVTVQTIEKGFDNFQVASFKNGKKLFVSAPSLDEMEDATVSPAGQKKAEEYKGGRLYVSGITVAPSGDMLLNMQMKNKNIKTSMETYKDFLVMHVAGDGKLRKVYSIDTPAKGGIYNSTDPLNSPAYYASDSEIYLSPDGKGAYWLTSLVTRIDEASYTYYFLNEKTTTWTPREQLLMSRINLDAGTMEEVKALGDGVKGKKDFFLRRDMRFLNFNGGNSLLVLGEDRVKFGFGKKNNYIYLGRIDF